MNETHFVLAYTYKTLFGDLHAYVKLGKIDAATGNIDWLDDGWNDVGQATLPSISLNRFGTVERGKRGQSQVLTQIPIGGILWLYGPTVAHRISWGNLSCA